MAGATTAPEAPEARERTIYILAGGSIADPAGILRRMEEEPPWFIICADGGARYAADIGITPCAIIGDMDSIDSGVLSLFRTRGCSIIRHPSAKDETDTELALRHALTLEPRRILLFGALGGRIDHSLGNIFLLMTVTPGVDLRIIDDQCELFLITEERRIAGRAGQRVSLIPLSPVVTGITLKGFAYPLKEATMTMGHTLGVSNRLTAPEGVVRVRDGRLLAICSYDREDGCPGAEGTATV